MEFDPKNYPQLYRKYQDAADLLSMHGVPEKDEHGQKLTLFGRIKWLFETVPDLEDRVQAVLIASAKKLDK